MKNSYQEDVLECAKKLRKHQTEAEQMLWSILRNRKFHGYRFLRQKPILTYIADFYCSEFKLIIEVDGNYHDDIRQMECDKIRESELQAFGKWIIRYTNDEVLFDLPSVLTDLKRNIDDYIQSHPRPLSLKKRGELADKL